VSLIFAALMGLGVPVLWTFGTADNRVASVEIGKLGTSKAESHAHFGLMSISEYVGVHSYSMDDESVPDPEIRVVNHEPSSIRSQGVVSGVCSALSFSSSVAGELSSSTSGEQREKANAKSDDPQPIGVFRPDRRCVGGICRLPLSAQIAFTAILASLASCICLLFASRLYDRRLGAISAGSYLVAIAGLLTLALLPAW
jgi:hypothetical protein